jgi:uncharacterized membrane protein YccC
MPSRMRGTAMTARPRLVALFAARDPGRARLAVALAVAAGALTSALLGMAVINAFHAEKGFLAMSLFLSVMAGSMVRDRSAAARVATTALIIPFIVLTIGIAMSLLSMRPVLIGGFILATGAAIWVRRFGPRASAIGSMCFMGYFFTMFMKPTIDELPVFILISVAAVGTQVIARAVLVLKRPRREITVLLKELRAASAAAVHAAVYSRRPKELRAAMARLDEVGRAITAWQEHFLTAHVIAIDEQALAGQVLDARVDTEEAAYELARAATAASDAASTHAAAQLKVVLDERGSASAVSAAEEWADDVVAQRGSAPHLADYLVARSVIAHVRLRRIDLSRPLAPAEPSVPGARTRVSRPVKTTSRQRHHLRWVPWSQWAPTTRMALQAMIAASIASGVGEAISATRWYWAVMTAFVIFVGSTTRSGILTRAVRRVIGTIIGIVIGVAIVALVGHDSTVLVAVCVIAIFGMLYFGPLNYMYSATCVTTMLVSLYSLLGVLDQSLLELRLVETLVGAVIGVLCAYLIVSADSNPTLMAKVNAFFDGLDALLQTVLTSFGAREESGDALRKLNDLEALQNDIDQLVSGMAAAFRVSGSQRATTSVHLMYIVTRSAARLTQTVITPSSASDAVSDESRTAVSQAISAVQDAAADARRSLCVPNAKLTSGSDSQTVLERIDAQSSALTPAATVAVMALARMDWALRRISADRVIEGRRHSGIPAVTLPPE